jgi:trehalose 6-phosphate synthase/phosphatase
MLHHVADVYGPLKQADIGAKGQQDLWFTYSTVNRIFRDKVVEVFQAGDMVWIQGFHLMLLPSFLRRFLQQARIGYFFHTPFPSSEIWRRMTRREDLLRGILAADQIGFHLYEYARHFLTTCHR